MTISTQEPAVYRHPRWFVCSAALGFAILYVCALAVANIFPHQDLFLLWDHGEQEHGWPFVYMLRESRVPGGLTIFYGPWPLDNPPLLQFHPNILLLDIVCAGILAAIATVVPVYWLGIRQTPFQFSLRSLFVLTLLVAGGFVALIYT